jgi:hypothetical protein
MTTPSKITSKFLKDLLKDAKKEWVIDEFSEEKDLSLIWKTVVGEKMATLTQVKSFYQGILVIKVASASLNQLLSTTEKPKILLKLKTDYPFLKIKNLIFRSG